MARARRPHIYVRTHTQLTLSTSIFNCSDSQRHLQIARRQVASNDASVTKHRAVSELSVDLLHKLPYIRLTIPQQRASILLDLPQYLSHIAQCHGGVGNRARYSNARYACRALNHAQYTLTKLPLLAESWRIQSYDCGRVAANRRPYAMQTQTSHSCAVSCPRRFRCNSFMGRSRR